MAECGPGQANRALTSHERCMHRNARYPHNCTLMLVLMLFMLLLMLMLLMLLLMLLMLMLKMLMLMSFFVDAHYVCSSVAGSLCSTHKAHYPQNCGVTAPL